MRPRAAHTLLLACCSAIVLGACGSGAASGVSGHDAGAPLAGAGASVASDAADIVPATGAAAAGASCGTAAPEALAGAVGMVATRIYAGELTGTETRSDQRQVESYAPLLNALAGGSRTAVTSAVTTLVYSHTHVVRLRVTRAGTVLADVGGPYIIAPVSGSLRLHGRTVGHYVLSVQDDLGYVKLVTRFLGVPLMLRAGPSPVPVEGLLSPGPANVPDHGPVSYRGTSYEAFSFAARSFPGGPLRVSLLAPVSPSLASASCAAIRSSELAHAAQLVSRRFALTPANLPVYLKLVRSLTGGLLYARAGTRQLAGSTRPGPGALPRSGSVSYGGTRYEVGSFTVASSAGPLRVFQLTR